MAPTDLEVLERAETEEKVERYLRKKKLKRILAISALVLALVIIIAAFIGGRNSVAKSSEEQVAELEKIIEELELKIAEMEDTPIVIDPITPEIVLSDIYTEIREIGELASSEYLFTNAARFTDSKQIKSWNIPFTEKSFVMKWDGAIKAGIDLTAVTVEVKEDQSKIIVTMPKAEILSYEVFSDTAEVLDEKDNLFNSISIDDKVGFDQETEQEMKDRAVANGLLDKAQENAETLIYNLLFANPAIGDLYTIEFVIAD